MGDWVVDGNTIRRFGGGPIASGIQAYRWNGESRLYYSRSEDRAPGMMVPVCEPDIAESETPVTTQEARELLRIYGLTEKDVPLDAVPTTSPDELKKLLLE